MRKIVKTDNNKEVILTDCAEEARTLQRKGPVIGICSPGSRQSWTGISFVAESWEAADEEYAGLAYCRYYGLPRVLIRTEEWSIREAGKEDAEGFFWLYEDSEAKRFLEYPLSARAAGPETWADWIESLHKYVYPSEEPSMWVLADRDDRMMGRIGLEWRDEIAPGYYLGYALLPQYRKKRLAARAASRLVPYCMEYWQLDQIFLLCGSDNPASVKTALRSGFQLIAQYDVLRSQHIVQHGPDDSLGVSSGKLLLFSRK